MPNERNYYVLCDDNCRFEGMTKEQILAAIVQAVESHEISDVDTGFVTKIKEQNANKQLKFWVGTTVQFNALETKAENTLYILSDDDTEDSLELAISNLQTSLQNVINGEITVGKANNAINAENVRHVYVADSAHRDKRGREFIDSYLHDVNYSFHGDPTSGVYIEGKKQSKGGSFYLVTWEKTRYEKICFGVIWWDGETTTYSAVTKKYTDKRYVLKITYGGEVNSEYNYGSATIVELDDIGTESPISSASYNLELKNLSETYMPE